MNTNPFVLPGFGQTGPLGQNPILASMEMMRQAWEGLASSGGMDAAAMGRMMSVEEMDKRISDLRAVENWLRMNLSMLSSTIQGLEVQRATVATLKSFVDTGMASMTPPTADVSSAASAPGQDRPRTSSPLEEALGLKPAAGRGEAAESSAPAGKDAEGAGGMAGQAAEPDAGMPPDQSDIVAAAASAAQGWWNLLQQQFQTLAAATAASAEGAFSEVGKSAAASAGAGRPASAGEPEPAARTARKSASRTAAKSTAKKAASRKTAARTAAKASSARKTAR